MFDWQRSVYNTPTPIKEPVDYHFYWEESQSDLRMQVVLTELVEVCLHAVGPWHRADEPGLQKGAPLVDQTAVASVIILHGRVEKQNSFSITRSYSHPPLSSYWKQTQVEPPTHTHKHYTVHVGLQSQEAKWRRGAGGGYGKHCLLLFRLFHLWWSEARIHPSKKEIKPVCALNLYDDKKARIF